MNPIHSLMTAIKGQVREIRYLLRRPHLFSLQTGSIELRPYQEQAIQAVLESVIYDRGMSFVWIFPRQSGKDESLAILVQYLLTRSMQESGEMVFFNPTFKPQTETSMRRLETRLRTNVLTRGKWKRKSGYIFNMGNAFCTYMSADPSAHVVSATANLLLIVNEAQDISPFKYDKDLDPMVASTNATKLFSGTRWTSDTLLEREYQRAREAEKADPRHLQRVFFFTADDVRKYVPAYGKHVDGVIARLGRQHPLVKTQFFCETIDAQAGMFPPGRQALMKGSHSSAHGTRARENLCLPSRRRQLSGDIGKRNRCCGYPGLPALFRRHTLPSDQAGGGIRHLVQSNLLGYIAWMGASGILLSSTFVIASQVPYFSSLFPFLRFPNYVLRTAFFPLTKQNKCFMFIPY